MRVHTENNRVGHAFYLALALLAAGPVRSGADSLLIVHPQSWESAITNYAAFKQRLGYTVTNIATETIGGGSTPDADTTRDRLIDYTSNLPAGNGIAYALLVGNFTAIPAPVFQVTTNDGTYESDIVYRDLHTEFDSDGDGIYGEYAAAGGQDFEDATFPAVFGAISNDLIVGRMPFNAIASAETVAAGLERCIAFEREVSNRKNNGILSAGRITTSAPIVGDLPCDSWDYVVKGIAQTITNDYPGKEVTTVVHVASNHADRVGIDYAVEGDDITGDYDRGQDIIRGLWETNDNCSLLCNCSHGGSNYDFALRRTGAGFPQDVRSAVVISMSCASFPLGRSAFLQGVAVAYLGSTATVTPDVENIALWSGRLVSGEVQKMATIDIFCENRTVGMTFVRGFNYYVQTIPTAGLGVFFGRAKPDILRNIVGFQIIGDPTLVHAYPDGDGDGLLDAEETTIGTLADNSDSDGDGLPDGLEFRTPGYDPTVHDGEDVDDDGSINADEIVAGTSPFDDSEFLAFERFTREAAWTEASWYGVSGRVYALYSSTNLFGEAWTPVPGLSSVTGVNSVLTCTNASLPETMLFYRIGVRAE